MDHICESCGKGFRSQQNLDYHIDHKACKIITLLQTTVKKKKDNNQKAEIYERLLKLEEINKKLQQQFNNLQKENKILK